MGYPETPGTLMVGTRHRTITKNTKWATLTSPKNPRVNPGACTNGEQFLFLIIHQDM